MARRTVLPLAVLLLLVGLSVVVRAPDVTLGDAPAALPGMCLGVCADVMPDPTAIQPSLSTINYSATSCAVQEGMTPPGPQSVVRLTTAIPNYGLGDFRVGNPQINPENFYWSACHGHYHTRDYASYRVWKPEGWAAWTALRAATNQPSSVLLPLIPPELQPVSGGKQGFCVLDVRNYIPGMPAHGYGCSTMGISSGWADVYSSGITGQWVVITGVPSGNYVLEVEVNAQRLFLESEFTNNSVGVPFNIP